jgi:hypothetical protein
MIDWNRVKDFCWAAVGLICSFTWVILVVFGGLHFVNQVGNWLKNGTWSPTTVFDDLKVKGVLPSKIQAWIEAPDDWIGVWQIVNVVVSWSAWWVYLILAVLFSTVEWLAFDAAGVQDTTSDT